MFKALLKAFSSWWVLGFGSFVVALGGWFVSTRQSMWDTLVQGVTWAFQGIKYAIESYFDLGLSLGESAMLYVTSLGGIDPSVTESVFSAINSGNRYIPFAELFTIASLVLAFHGVRSLTKFVMAYLSIGGI